MEALKLMDIMDNDNIFGEKVRVLSDDYLKCCIYISGIDTSRHVFTKNLYSKLIATSQVLEDFLDFHGAKNNKEWYFYRELSAAVRHLSLGGYSQKHISNRLRFYDGLPDKEKFDKEGKITLDFLTECLKKMAPVILHEARRLHIPIPHDRFTPADFPGIETSEMLDYDINGAEHKQEQKENIVRIASEFLGIATYFDTFTFYEPYDLKGILEIVPSQINEVEIRRYEMLVHNLQSYFDTYVIHGGYSCISKKLREFRSFFSVVFHLLNMMGRLLHFYERHLHEAGCKDIYKSVQNRLSSFIDPEMLLDRTINYGLYYVCHFLTSGKKLVSNILNENIERASVKVNIPTLGFHCRPSLLVAKIVQTYGGQVELCVAGDRFDASSVLDLQWAGGKIQKERIKEVLFEGDARALKDIEVLASVNYGEDTMGKGIALPEKLRYLR